MITDHNNNTFIIDTKWKLDAYKNPSNDDLKQMFTYNLLWGAEKSVLVYPNNGKITTMYKGEYQYRSTDMESNSCVQIFVPVIKDNYMLDSIDTAKAIFSILKS